jgi:hypothetical protein
MQVKCIDAARFEKSNSHADTETRHYRECFDVLSLNVRLWCGLRNQR